MPSAFSILASVAADVFAVRERLSIGDWSDKHRQLVKGSQKGAWETDKVPYAARIFEALADPDVETVTIMKAAQLGGSEIGYCWLCWLIENEPGDFLLVMPTKEKAQDLKKNRLLETFNQCEPVKERMAAGARVMDGLIMQFMGMNVVLRGSNSEAALEGDPFARAWIDERDRCVETIVGQVAERMKTFANRKLLITGTPEFEGLGIDLNYQQGTKERFYVPCPACKEYHTRELRHVRWDGGKKADPKAVLHSAYMRCPHCKARINARDNRWQQKRGVWCPSTCRVSKDGTIVGELPPKGHVSVAIHGLDNALVANPYGEVASKFVTSECRRTMNFVNRTLGEVWKAKTDGLKLATLKERCGKEEYTRGQIPPGVLALVASADVQTDRMYAQVWGFGEGGTQAWLIDYATLPRDNGADDPLNPLNKWIDGSTWNKSGTPRSVVREFVDSGDDTLVVYASCRKRGLTPMAGGAKVMRRLPVKGNGMMLGASRMSTLDKNSAGDGAFAGMRLLLVNSTSWSTWMYGRLGTAVNDGEEGMWGEEATEGEKRRSDEGEGEGTEHKAQSTDAESLPTASLPIASVSFASSVDDEPVGITPEIHLPRNCDDEFLTHLCTEQLETVFVNGTKKRRWKLKNDHDPNHHADAMRYAIAGADAVGARKLRAKKGPGVAGSGVGVAGVGVGVGGRKAEEKNDDAANAPVAASRSTRGHASWLLQSRD